MWCKRLGGKAVEKMCQYQCVVVFGGGLFAVIGAKGSISRVLDPSVKLRSMRVYYCEKAQTRLTRNK